MNLNKTISSNNNMIGKFVRICVISVLVLVAACDRKEEDASRLENYYNVYFIMPKGERTYIGTVRGISSCKYTASSYYSHRLWIGKGWDYVCCLRTKDSQCAEEQKYDKN